MLEFLNQVSMLIDAVVDLFMSVFGFLPPWVLLFVGSAVVLSVGIFIYKLIRG